MKDISRILNQLESISTKSNCYGSRTDGTQKYENINTNGNYYAFQDENRRLNAELLSFGNLKEGYINRLIRDLIYTDGYIFRTERDISRYQRIVKLTKETITICFVLHRTLH